MNTAQRPLLVIPLVLLLMALACRSVVPGEQTIPSAEPTAAAVEPHAQANPASPTVVSGETGDASSGSFTFATPYQGIDQLTHYRQRFKNTVRGTYKGQPYDYVEIVERVVAGSDEMDTVESSTNGETISLFSARLGATHYSQQKAGMPCQTAQAGKKPVGANLARKLPPVFGAVLENNEALRGTPAAAYHFDEQAVRSQAGKNGTAEGKLWMAEDGSLVLKYELTVQIKDGDFFGERTWLYTLEVADAHNAFPISLPDVCQPLLLDFPTLPNAANVQNQPGFMRYTVEATRAEARRFFLDAMPGAGWEPLPSTSKEPDAQAATADSATLTFVKAASDGSGQVAVIQLLGMDGALTVVVQTAKTKTAVRFDEPVGSIPTPEDEDAAEPPLGQEGAFQPKLPEEIEVYKGAQVFSQTESMIMFTTPDPQEDVAAFYATLMEDAGWEIAQEHSGEGSMIQIWQKDEVKVILAFTDVDGSTMVVINAE